MSDDRETLRRRTLELFDAGRTQRAIADELGIPSSTVHFWLARAGYWKGSPTQRQQHQQQRSAAADAYRTTHNVRDVARQLGISPNTALRYLREEGIVANRSPRKPIEDPQFPIPQARQLWVNEQLGYAEIARRTGLSLYRVRTRIQAYNLTRPDPHAVLTRELLELWYVKERRSARNIAAQLGVSHSVVLSALGQYGLLRERRSRQAPPTDPYPTPPESSDNVHTHRATKR